MDKLQVKNLTISFRTNNGAVRAVRDISFNLKAGETLAIAGESGSGKSVTTRAIMGILANNAMVDNGEIIYDGRDLLKISEDDFHTLRGHKLAMVFQDPLSALNPIMKIGAQLTEAMLLNNKERRRDGRARFNRILSRLEKTIIAEKLSRGEHGDVKGEVQKNIKEFNEFTLNGVNMEKAYETARENIVSCQDHIEEIEIALIRKGEKAVREIISRMVDISKDCFDPFLISKENAEFSALIDKLTHMKTTFTTDQANLLKGLLSALNEKLTEALQKPLPNFFCIGYYTLHGGTIDLSRSTIEEINASARKAIDSGFMLNFLADIEKALIYSAVQSAEMQKKAITVLEAELPVFKTEKLNERACRAAAKRAADAVEAAIDPLRLAKDNLSYVFRSSLKANLDRYFKGLVHNPKEQRRFDRDTEKYNKLVAAKKHADSVVPINLINLDIARKNIITAFEQLISAYKAASASTETSDFSADAVTMVDYLKRRASEYAYVLSKAMAKHRAIELMKEVGIPEPHKRFDQYPFELSGGMRQRIVIAIALSANPDILICDEPTTALDVTIQAQILELINRLKRERNLSVIFITHDLGVVANMADQIAIMYAGKIVEYGTADDVFYDPRHPYTWALLSSMPDLETKEKLDAIPGTPPNMIIPPKGDAFAARNHYAMQIDFEQQPPMFQINETHQAATWLLHPNAPKVEPPAIVRERIERMNRKQASATNAEGKA